jgi:hypothetical protein
MRSSRARGGGDVLFGSAGWLFADLMLALVVMLFLAAAISAPEEPASKPAASRTTTSTTTTTTPPVTTTPPPPPGLLRDPVKLDLIVDTAALLRNDPGVIQAMRGEVGALLFGPLAGRRVGMVLTFGSATSSDIQRGIEVARLFNLHVLQAYGGQFAGAVYRNFFTGGGDLRKIAIEVYVYDR